MNVGAYMKSEIVTTFLLF